MTMILNAQNITKSYNQKKLTVLKNLSLQVERGEFICLMGPSGSGKSTLMHIMGGLETPDQGEVWIDGVSLKGISDSGISQIRREKLGFVFQFFNLLPTMTALENVLLPAIIDGKSFARAEKRALELLDLMGLSERAHHRPTELSGGQMQRVAIARALFGEPKLILADEPTGNLDSTAGEGVLQLFQKINREFSQSIVMVTHDPSAARVASRIIRMRDGQIVLEERGTKE